MPILPRTFRWFASNKIVANDASSNREPTITPPSAGCDMCSKITDLLDISSLKDKGEETIQLGEVDQLLAVDCPHVTWLRDMRFFNRPLPSFKNCHLSFSWLPGFGWCCFHLIKQGSTWTKSTYFDQAFRPEISKHHGTIRILDSSWIDLDLIKHWISRCSHCHMEYCDKTIGDVPSFRPQLLINVVQGCVMECQETNPRFVTLSYTWGQSKNFRVIKSNVKEMQKPGALISDQILAQLPATVLDAINLTKALGETWLWIDSLCIVQDDQDCLKRELAAMHRIYATSFLTIVAGDGLDAEYGLRGFKGISKPRTINQVVLPFPNGVKIARMGELRSNIQETEGFSYYQRMWTAQEYDFSKRRLVFVNGEVKWECNYTKWTENRVDQPDEGPRETSNDHYIGHRAAMKVPSLGRLGILIRRFNEKAVRFEEDVYNAFAGYNTHLSSIFPSGLVYGHPQIFFEISLCWSPISYIQRRKASDRYNGDPLRAGLPSWSWMGWKGQVDFPHDHESEEYVSSGQGFTEAITEWYAMEYPSSSHKQRINSLWSQCRKTPPGSLSDLWRCEKFKPPAVYRHGSRYSITPWNMPKDMPIYRYVYHSDDEWDAPKRWYPVPINQAGTEEVPSLGLDKGYQYLWCQTSRAFFIATQDIATSYTGQDKYYLLKDTSGKTVGALDLHYEESCASLQQDTAVELVAVAKGWNSVLEWNRTVEAQDTMNECKESQEVPWMEEWERAKKYKRDCYHVLWIEWENGVAYRRACGFVFVEEWDSVAEKVDITLG